MKPQENLAHLSREQLEQRVAALNSHISELTDFIENASLPLHRVDANGIVIWANQAELDALGYTCEEYIGQPITKFHADKHVIDDILTRLTSNEILRNYEARLLRKDGSIRHVLINSSVYRENNEFVHTRCFTRDITDRKLAEDRIRQSERQLRMITTALPVLIAYVGSDRRYRFVNGAYEKWFDRPNTEMVGKSMREVLGDDLYTIVQPNTELALRGQEVTFQSEVPHRSGIPRYVKTTYLPDQNANGEIQGFITLVHDITDRKQLEEDLRSAIHARDEFLSIASHEIKTPLTSLKLQLQMTQRAVDPATQTVPSPEKLAKVLDISMRQILRLQGLIEDLLDVAKIQSGKLSLHREPVHLATLIHEVCERADPQLTESNTAIDLDIDLNIHGHWDRNRIEQVVINLISNAMKYAPGKPITIRTSTQGERAHLEVTDHGEGIPAEMHSLIFERFERQASTRHLPGLGLGLFIVKQIVEAHAGTITLTSEMGRGTTFMVTLPLAPALPPHGNQVKDART